MAKNAPLTEDEAQELFSELDDSGVIDPLLAHRRVRTFRWVLTCVALVVPK